MPSMQKDAQKEKKSVWRALWRLTRKKEREARKKGKAKAKVQPDENLNPQPQKNDSGQTNSSNYKKIVEEVSRLSATSQTQTQSQTTTRTTSSKTEYSEESASPKHESIVDDKPKEVTAMMINFKNDSLEKIRLTEQVIGLVGHGVFSNVYKAMLTNADKKMTVVAIKKTWPDDITDIAKQITLHRYCNHENLARLTHFFYTEIAEHSQTTKLCWQLVFEYMPSTLIEKEKEIQDERYRRKNMSAHHDPALIQLWSFQLFRALTYLHSNGICHRDVKPENMLLDPVTNLVKLADLGNGKFLRREQRNSSYQVTRYYRAPELCFRSQSYDVRIDVWAAGAVLAGLALGEILWPGSSWQNQLQLIIDTIGYPTEEEKKAMHARTIKYTWKHPKKIKTIEERFNKPWHSKELIAVLKQIFVFDPRARPSCFDVVNKSPYYEPVRNNKKTWELLTRDPVDPAILGEDCRVPTDKVILEKMLEIESASEKLKGENVQNPDYSLFSWSD